MQLVPGLQVDFSLKRKVRLQLVTRPEGITKHLIQLQLVILLVRVLKGLGQFVLVIRLVKAVKQRMELR